MSLLKHKIYLLIGLFCFISSSFFGQDQVLADSLIDLYNSEETNPGALNLLRDITENETNPEKMLFYCDVLISMAEKDSLTDYLISGYMQKGNAFQIKGDNTKALEAFFKSLEYAEKSDYQKGIGSLYVSIADTYSIIDNATNAEIYYDKGIKILRVVNDSIQLASVLLNAGDEQLNAENYTKALAYFDESGNIFKNLDYPVGTAYNKGNIGMAYAELENDSLALQHINEAIVILEELQDFYPISVYLTYMADIYVNKDEFNKATLYAHRSLQLAKQYNLKDQISEANLKLYELYDSRGKSAEALNYYKDHIVYRDSVKNIENVQQAANMRTKYEVAEKQTEVDLLNEVRKKQRILVFATIFALLAIVVVARVLYKRNKFTKATNKIIKAEKQISEQLLLNILPEETAKELKENGKVAAKNFESVTVLFTDFKGFSTNARYLTPEELVKSVDFYFSKFDDIMEKYGLEKIKTVGDAYMCAGGLPFPTNDHAYKMVLAGLEIAEFVNFEKKRNPNSKTHFDIRIGVHTGPVVAGVVGSKKFAYDIWGDTVNIASRMESSSEAGKVNISESTHDLVKDKFESIYRGEIEVKNRGKFRMYFVS